LREGRWNLRTLISSSSRRRKRDGRKWRAFKGGLRRIVRHPLFPRQPLTIVCITSSMFCSMSLII
jgi:hypothetical protein